MADRYIVGVDIGGTNIHTGVVTMEGEVLGGGVKVPTQADRPKEVTEGEGIVRSIQLAIEAASIGLSAVSGIGLGVPGPLDIETGTILTPWNLPNMHHYPLRESIARRYGLPVAMNNDANCFALAEALFGAGKGAKVVCGITLGTGLGCGIVLGGTIFSGATGNAGEIWASPYRDGNFEDYVSGRAIAKAFERHSGRSIDGAEIQAEALNGDPRALECWQDFGEHLGFVLAHLINMLDPHIIVLGGSVAYAFDLFRESMEETTRGLIVPSAQAQLKVVVGSLGDFAGLIGAAALLLQ